MFDSDKAANATNRMWLRLARKLDKSIDGENNLTTQLRTARAAEACYWQATGEGTSNDLKDVIS